MGTQSANQTTEPNNQQGTMVNNLQKEVTLTLLSYSEWNTKGRRIHKGKTARGSRDGEALFALIDTYDPNPKHGPCYYFGLPHLGEWDDPPH